MTDTVPTLAAQMRMMLDAARKNLERDPELVPFLFASDAANRAGAFDLRTLPKQTWPTVARILASKPEVTRLILVSEAWGAKKVDGNTRRPSEREDRTEVILVDGADRSGDRVTMAWPFDRDDNGKPVFRDDTIRTFESGGFSRVLGEAFA